MIRTSLEEVISAAKNRKTSARLAVVAAAEENTLEAVIRAARDHIVEPVLIGDKEKISDLLRKMGESIPDDHLVDLTDDREAAQYAVDLVKAGKADIIMKGLIHTSHLFKTIVNKETGLPNNGIISHFAMLEIPSYHKLLFVSDVGIVVNPTLPQKVSILNNAVDMLHRLGYENPNVAVLTAVEEVNLRMPETADALALKEMNQRGEISGCTVEGPISMDVAFNKKIADIKGFSSPVVGEVDFALVPSVVAGNLMVKAIKSFLPIKTVALALGASVPLVVTSRASSADNKYQSIAVAAASVRGD